MEVKRHFGATCRLDLQGSEAKQETGMKYATRLLFNQKMEAACSSEMSINFQWTARRYIPEGTELFTVHVF
jgi:hypothetical protein